MTAEVYKQELVRDAFINGLLLANICQHLLENTTLTLDNDFTQARTLDQAQKSSNAYNPAPLPLDATGSVSPLPSPNENTAIELNAAMKCFQRCYFCGGSRHDRRRCPAKDAVCNKCSKEGHFAKVYQFAPKSNSENMTSAAARAFPPYLTLASMLSAAVPGSLRKAIVDIKINRHDMQPITTEARIDTGSSDSYISKSLTEKIKLKIQPTHATVSFAESSIQVNSIGYAVVDIIFVLKLL